MWLTDKTDAIKHLYTKWKWFLIGGKASLPDTYCVRHPPPGSAVGGSEPVNGLTDWTSFSATDYLSASSNCSGKRYHNFPSGSNPERSGDPYVFPHATRAVFAISWVRLSDITICKHFALGMHFTIRQLLLMQQILLLDPNELVPFIPHVSFHNVLKALTQDRRAGSDLVTVDKLVICRLSSDGLDG